MSSDLLLAGTRLPSGCGFSTVLPDLDFETYSEAGNVWDDAAKKWLPLHGATKRGIAAVGAAVYAEHPSTEILSLAYNLKDGLGARLWVPGCPPPEDLFAHIRAGGLLEAWNDSFEYWIWLHVCERRLGWQALPFWQLRDAMAKARAYALPGKLSKAGDVLQIENGKLSDGDRLLKKFSVPRNPTKNNPATRIRVEDDPVDAGNLYFYNLGDIKAESEISAHCPDLEGVDLDYWLCTRAMNIRGMAIDVETVNAGVKILDQALDKYNAELHALTGGAVAKASEVQKLQGWLGAFGVHLKSLDADHTKAALKRTDLPAPARRAIEIRQLVGSAGVKKLYALQRQTTAAGRACDMFIFNGARTGRDTGADIQPQNLVKAGVELFLCSCGAYYGTHRHNCPYCPATSESAERMDWTFEAVDQASALLKTERLDYVESVFGDAMLLLSGCIRGLFVAGEGKDLIASDYSSIEAVVAAVVAGEQWRIDAFIRKEDIYLVSAGRIVGKSLEDYERYKQETGNKHPDRQKIGKPAELGLGFGGWLNGWRVFDSSDTFTDEEVKANIVAWREASPMIVECWGGQCRGKPWAPDSYELYGLEGMAIKAVLNPGEICTYRDISYGVKNDTLFCRLPSGRLLTYHKPRLTPSKRWENQLELSFEGWNSNPTNGAIGWIRIGTFGGRLFENVVQAIANDILRFATVGLERAGYPIVLRVHDELVAEVPEGEGSVEEFEAIMATLPDWAQKYPIRAAGGWRGKRYRKD